MAHERMTFSETVKDDRWRAIITQEIHMLEKMDMGINRFAFWEESSGL